MYLGQWPRESLRGSQGRAKGWRSGFLEEGEVAVEKQRTVQECVQWAAWSTEGLQQLIGGILAAYQSPLSLGFWAPHDNKL